MADKADEGPGRKAIGTTSVTERLKLQTNYGRALAWSRGFATEETKAAYSRARELSAVTDVSDERFATLYGQWVTTFVSGELGQAWDIAETFRREAENAGRITETAVGLRYLGLTCLNQGEFRAAETYLLRALEAYDPQRDREANLRYGVDTGAGALIYLAEVNYDFGKFTQARELSEEAVARALESGHAPTIGTVYQSKALLEILRGDPAATRHTAEALIELSQRHGLEDYVAWGQMLSAWARAKLGDRETGVAELQQSLRKLAKSGRKLSVPYYQALLAEMEADGHQGESDCSMVTGFAVELDPDRRSAGASAANG
jgi:predicted ATPase